MIKKLFNLIKNYWSNYYLIPIVLGIFLFDYLYLFIGLLIFILFYKKYGEKVIVLYTIISFLSLTSSLNLSLRFIVQVSNFIILTFLVFKSYGLEFKKYPIPPKFFIIIVASYISILIFSTIFSSYKQLAFEQIFRTILFFVLVYYYYALLAYYKDINFYLGSFFIIGIFFAGLLIYQFIFKGFSLLNLESDYLIQLKDFYVHKNTIGVFFTIVIIFSTVLHFNTNNSLYKTLLKLTIILFLLGLLISNSRSSIMVLIIGLMVLMYILKKKYFYGILVILVTITSLVFIEPINKIVNLYFRVETIASGRDIVYPAVFAALPHIWLTGAGPAASKYYMFMYYPFQMGTPEFMYWDYYVAKTEFGHAHNFYLFYFADLGILGLLFSILFPILYIKLGYKSILYLKNTNQKLYFTMLSITIIALTYFIRGLLEWGGILSYGFISIDLPFWILFIVFAFIYLEYVKSNTQNE